MLIFLLLSLSTDFADFLFQDGDYFRAITEYKRILYYGDNVDTGMVMEKIGLSYAFSGKYEKALDYISTAYQFNNDKNTMEIYAYLLLMNKRWNEVEMLTEGSSDSLIMVYRGIALVEEGRWKEGKDLLSELLPEQLQPTQMNINRYISYIIPGSGQIIAGRIRGGIVSMVINFGLGYFTYKSILNRDYINAFILGLNLWKFYRGNIKVMDGIIKEENEKRIKDILGKIP